MSWTGKIPCSLVLKLEVCNEAYFRVLIETLQQHCVSCELHSFLLITEQYTTRYFFNARHKVKAISIKISKDNPLAEIGWLLWSSKWAITIGIVEANPLVKIVSVFLSSSLYMLLGKYNFGVLVEACLIFIRKDMK